MLTKILKKEIIAELKQIKPYKIILFGSHALGNPSEGSDIDLIVVTRDELIPRNYKEKTELYLQVSKRLSKIIERVPIDLIVYTKPMFEKFIELDSLFSRDILRRGVIWYETDNKRMA